MRKLILSAACATLAAFSPAWAQSPMRGDSQEEYRRLSEEAMKSSRYDTSQGQDWDIRLQGVSGTVTVKPSGSEDWSQAEPGTEMPLESGDTVKTGPDGAAELYFDDKGAVYLNSNSQMEVSSADQADSSLLLRAGSLVAKIKHFLSDRYRLQVRTPAAVCAIRGTEFAVEYSELSKDTGVAVFDEGRVAVTALDESGGAGEEFLLEKNSEVTFAPAQKRIRVVPLERLKRHSSRMGRLRTRLPLLKKSWKRLSPARRAELRGKAIKRRIIRRQVGAKVKPSEKVTPKRKRRPGSGKRARPAGKAAASGE